MVKNYSQNLKHKISNTLTNFWGWRTNRKIIIFESDDWGSIRMPSRKVFKTLSDNGIQVERSLYCRYDSLESNSDLYLLFDILKSFKDFKGNHPVITANTVVANPDFERIKNSSFQKYFYEPFTETLKKYPNRNDVYSLYKEGINNRIFFPQFHGREHVNIEMWMNLIRTNSDFKLAFENKMWGLSNDVFPNLNSIQATYDSNNEKLMNESITSGLELFETLFGYKSESFIANNFVWGLSLEKKLAELGVKHLQGMKYQKLPRSNYNNPNKHIRRYLGETNEYKQIYSVRNCSFEPSIDGYGYDKTMKEIGNAFFWKKPAIISSHRINFIGSIDECNQKRNALEFKKLLKAILKKWPNAEFMHTMSLNKIIRNQN